MFLVPSMTNNGTKALTSKRRRFKMKHFECFASCRNCKPTQKESSTVVSIAVHYGGARAESTHVPRSYSQSDKMQVLLM